MKCKLNLTTTILALSCLSSVGLAGQHVGNGGDVVLCQKGGPATYEVLDFYESRTIRNFQIDFGSEKTPLEMALFAISRLRDKDEIRFNVYTRRAQDFFDRALFVDDDLPAVADEGELDLEVNCNLLQLAVRTGEVLPEDRLYKINKPLWDLLDAKNKAILILHEITWWDGMQRGHKDSKMSRYFSSLIASKQLSNLSKDEYIERAVRSGFYGYSFSGESKEFSYRYSYFLIDRVLEINDGKHLCSLWSTKTNRKAPALDVDANKVLENAIENSLGIDSHIYAWTFFDSIFHSEGEFRIHKIDHQKVSSPFADVSALTPLPKDLNAPLYTLCYWSEFI